MSTRRSARLQQKIVEAVKPKLESAKVAKPKATAVKPTKPKESSVKGTEVEAIADKKESKHAAVGSVFPSGISLLNQDSKPIDLSKLAATKGTIVIFAYPKASTPGCTRQACGFRDQYPKYTSQDVTVFGLSADSVNAQKNFKTKQNLPYDLLSDPDFSLIEYLGAKKTATGGIIRSHWIIKDGKFAQVKVGVKPDESFETALKSV